MHRCLSCNQPCNLFSAFCNACRADLLSRREQVILEEQPEMVKAGGGSDGEGGYTDRARDEGMTDLLSFPRPDGPLVGSRDEQAATMLSEQREESSAWTFETSGIYSVETLNDGGEVEGVSEMENRTGVAQATHVLAVPPRARRVMPRSVRRALFVFCLVGILAFITDGVLLALSFTRHHIVAGTRLTPSGMVDQQRGVLPTAVSPLSTPTSTMPVSTTSMLALSTQRLAFSAVLGQTNLAAQNITLFANHQSFAWRVEPASSPPAWLRLSSWQGTVGRGMTASFAVSVHPTGLNPGVYTASLLVKAFDAQGNELAGSPGTLVATLTIHHPCVLTVTPEKLSFAAVLVSVPSPQTLTLSESSGCVFPVSWQVSADESWVTFSSSSGTDSTSGNSIIVQASSADKLIGSYPAVITFQGTDSSGAPLVISPTTITAVLTVIA